MRIARSYRFEPKTIEAIDSIAVLKDWSATKVIKHAVESYLSRLEREEKPNQTKRTNRKLTQ